MSMSEGAARRLIRAAGGVEKHKDRGRAFNRVAAALDISRQAVQKWYAEGWVPERRVSALEDMSKTHAGLAHN